MTAYGIEGGAIYALSPQLREAIALKGVTSVGLDLRPDLPVERLAARLVKTPDRQSLANHLRKAGLTPVEINLLRESRGKALPTGAAALAALIKAVPLMLTGVAPLDRAISTAGGVSLDAVDKDLMLTARPGVFVAGEMLDWEAPTGGYLLQACFATGATAARGVLKRLGGPVAEPAAPSLSPAA